MASYAVIGGGWYGCHASTVLLERGHDVTLIEKSDRLFNYASGNNQSRLHLGFHYARNYETRRQSYDGFSCFVEVYPDLSEPVERNLYAISATESLMDARSYLAVMADTGLVWEDVRCPDWLTGVEHCFLTDERVVQTAAARRYFADRLESIIRYRSTSVPRADWIIDATWGHWRPTPYLKERTLLLYYQAKQPFGALTLMDGPLASIYPTDTSNLYTLSSVRHTPLEDGERENWETVAYRRALMEAEISKYVPAFRDMFDFRGPQFSAKTKPRSMSADRSCSVTCDGNVISIMSGKIDGIFYATDRALELTAG